MAYDGEVRGGGAERGRVSAGDECADLCLRRGMRRGAACDVLAAVVVVVAMVPLLRAGVAVWLAGR